MAATAGIFFKSQRSEENKLDEWFGANYQEVVVPTPESALKATPEQSLLF
jgi:hypothetical protein